MNKKIPAIIFLILSVLLSGCSVLPGREPTPDYKTLELTAAVRLTQTFEALPTSTDTPTPVPTSTPEPTATPTEIPLPTEAEEEFLITRGEEEYLITRNEPTIPPEPTATVYFPDKAAFDSALPSPNQFVPGQHFYLTWKLKNTGTTTWSGKYKFYYSEGTHLADQNSYEISETVEPGGFLTVVLPATAPAETGTFKTTWTLQNPDGIPFYYVNYVAIVGERTFITDVPELNPTATPSSLRWMCSDPERSLIQGSGCEEFCAALARDSICYVDGEQYIYGE